MSGELAVVPPLAIVTAPRFGHALATLAALKGVRAPLRSRNR